MSVKSVINNLLGKSNDKPETKENKTKKSENTDKDSVEKNDLVP